MKRVAMFSGGKDSAATMIVMRDLGIPPDIVIFCEVMFDKARDISGELPEHREWIYGTAKPIIESWGSEFVVVKGRKDYTTIFHERIAKTTKRPEREGLKKGFPIAGRCVIKRDCKIRPVQKYLRSINEPYIQFLGIAADEVKRLPLEKNCRSVLYEQGIVESKTFEIARKNKLLSPIYDNGKRGGCWFCPSAPLCEFARTKSKYRELWSELKRLDEETGKVSPYFCYNKTFSEIDKEVDDIINRGLFRQMSMWELLRERKDL